jgi:hypothetical protein
MEILMLLSQPAARIDQHVFVSAGCGIDRVLRLNAHRIRRPQRHRRFFPRFVLGDPVMNRRLVSRRQFDGPGYGAGWGGVTIGILARLGPRLQTIRHA